MFRGDGFFQKIAHRERLEGLEARRLGGWEANGDGRRMGFRIF
jgi:hypothetical protein